MRDFGINIVTPFTEYNEVDFDALKRVVDMNLSRGYRKFILGSKCGEFEMMNNIEILNISKFVKREVGKEAEVVVSIGCLDIRRSISLIMELNSIGVDAVIVKIPNIDTNSQGLLEYLGTLMKLSILPVYIETDGNKILREEMSLYRGLNSYPNFAGVIENSLEIERYINLITEISSKKVICGREEMIYTSMSLGIDSFVSSIANICHREVLEIVQLYRNGSIEASREVFLHMYPVFKLMNVEPLPITIKTTLNMLGYKVGEFRPPYRPMNPDNASNIIRTLMDKNLV